MATRHKRRERQKVTPDKVSPGARKSKSDTVSIPSYRPSRKKAYNPARVTPYRSSVRSQDTHSNSLHVAADMRRAAARGEKLTFTRAARERNVDPRSIRNHFKNLFYKDSSGRIHARKTDNYVQNFSIPTTRPDVSDTITARGSVERSLVGRWLNAIKAAGDGDFSLLQNFPKNTFVDGKRLPTAPYEVQKILEAVEQGKEDAFEQMYYGRGAR